MVKEYFEKKLEEVLENLQVKQQQYNTNSNLKYVLKKDIYKIQEESDLNFEVFYPRSNVISKKEDLDNLYKRLEKVNIENQELEETIKSLKEHAVKYKCMLEEIIEMENTNKE